MNEKIHRLDFISDWIQEKKKKKTGKLETTQSKNKEKDTKKINRASVSYGKSSLSLCICNWSILKDG